MNSEFLANSIDSLYVFNARRAAPLIPSAKPGRDGACRHATTRTRGPAAPRPPGPPRTGPDRGHGPRTGADGAPLAARPADGRAAPHQQRRGAAARRRTRRARGERARAGPRRGDEGRRRCDSCERRTVHNPAHAIVSHRLTSINLQRTEDVQKTSGIVERVRNDASRYDGRESGPSRTRTTRARPGPGPLGHECRESRLGYTNQYTFRHPNSFLISSGPASRPCRAS